DGGDRTGAGSGGDPMKRSAPLRRDPEKARAWRERSKPLRVGSYTLEKRAKPKRRPVSPASPEQRQKVKGARAIVSGKTPCDPAHIVSRSLGGCDDPLCVAPLTREEHRAYDRGELDLLPHLIAHGYVAELQHALGHYRG